MKARRFLIAGCWLVASREGALQADSPKPVLSLIEKDGKSVYLFPDEPLKDKDHACGHSSSYDVECCGWSNLPKNWAYLDRSHWRKDVPTLHVLPHWTWPERIGRTVPVYVYTSYLSAELFVNGQSQGRRTFDRRSRLDRFRLRWREVVYAPEDTLRFVRIDVVDERGDDWPDCGQPDLVCGDGGCAVCSCNGDPRDTDSFSGPSMKAFGGSLVVAVAPGGGGRAKLSAVADGLVPGSTEVSIGE